MTRAVTSVAAMQLIARDQIGLDEPAAQWLPALADVLAPAGMHDTAVAISDSMPMAAV